MGPHCPGLGGLGGLGLGAGSISTKGCRAAGPRWGQCLEEARQGKDRTKAPTSYSHFLFSYTPLEPLPVPGWPGSARPGMGVGSLDGRQGLWSSLLLHFQASYSPPHTPRVLLEPWNLAPPLATNQGTGRSAHGQPWGICGHITRISRSDNLLTLAHRLSLDVTRT